MPTCAATRLSRRTPKTSRPKRGQGLDALHTHGYINAFLHQEDCATTDPLTWRVGCVFYDMDDDNVPVAYIEYTVHPLGNDLSQVEEAVTPRATVDAIFLDAVYDILFATNLSLGIKEYKQCQQQNEG